MNQRRFVARRTITAEVLWLDGSTESVEMTVTLWSDRTATYEPTDERLSRGEFRRLTLPAEFHEFDTELYSWPS